MMRMISYLTHWILKITKTNRASSQQVSPTPHTRPVYVKIWQRIFAAARSCEEGNRTSGRS